MLSSLRKVLSGSALSRAACLTPLVQRKLSDGPSHIKTAQAFENISGNELLNFCLYCVVDLIPVYEFMFYKLYRGIIEVNLLFKVLGLLLNN
jgi:hypothetical protein